MRKNSYQRKENLDLYRAILSLRDLDECCRFFEDLCASTELQAMEQRFEVAKLLKDEEVYMDITKKTNASSATISRVNHMMQNGNGCISEVIDRISSEEEKN